MKIFVTVFLTLVVSLSSFGQPTFEIVSQETRSSIVVYGAYHAEGHVLEKGMTFKKDKASGVCVIKDGASVMLDEGCSMFDKFVKQARKL